MDRPKCQFGFDMCIGGSGGEPRFDDEELDAIANNDSNIPTERDAALAELKRRRAVETTA